MNNNSIGNFTIENVCEINMVTGPLTIPFVGFNLKLENGEVTEETIVPLTGPTGLEHLIWTDLHKYVVLYQKPAMAQRNLMNLIRLKLPNAPKETRYSLSYLGTHMVGDEPIFNTGGSLIRPSLGSADTHSIILQPQQYRIDIDPTLSEREAAAGVMEVVGLSPDAGRVIFSHSLLYIMRKVYEVAWRAPRCSLFLYGETGTAKTTYAAFLTQLHNRGAGIAEPIRLNATQAAAEKVLSKKSDCSVVLDDLFPTKYYDMKLRQEKTLTEITRVIGDGSGRALVKGNQLHQAKPTCGVIFTGEYLVGTGSTAARLLPVFFDSTIDGSMLHKCQRKPLIVSTFYHFFIQWYIDNYTKIQDSLEMWWEKYAETDIGVHKRLQETHFFLNTAYRLFLRYCVERGFTSAESAQDKHHSFKHLLTGLVKRQDIRVNQGDNRESDKVDYFELIREWYIGNSFDLAKDAKHLRVHDGFKHDGLLCLRSEKLMKKIQSVAPSATLDDVRNALLAKSALWRDREGKNKKIGQLRFYGLYLSKLK